MHCNLLKIFVVSLALGCAGANSLANPLQDGDSFGNWLIRCGPSGSETERDCFLFQNLVLKEGGQRVLQVAVGFVDNAPEPIALLSLPLGISIPPGASISIDQQDDLDLQIERCEANGCRAGLKLNAELIQKFKDGAGLAVTFHDGKRRPIEVPLSLEGFRDGYLALLDNRSSE